MFQTIYCANIFDPCKFVGILEERNVTNVLELVKDLAAKKDFLSNHVAGKTSIKRSKSLCSLCSITFIILL